MMDKKFHTQIKSVLDQSSSRFFYAEHDDRHYIGCRFTEDDDAMVVTTLVEAMRDNQALIGMEESEFQWEGASMISFSSKADAALFWLCLPH